MKRFIAFLLLAVTTYCQGQTKTTMNNNNQNPLLCDPVTGACEMPQQQGSTQATIIPATKPVKIIYYTDPICSSCWGIEPQLRKLKLEYGDYIDIEYRMGGLLPDWSYNSGGISKPADVAHHWDEASLYYEMPIDGDVWLEDPLDSSYPSCIAIKAAQMQDRKKAIVMMRLLREKLFLDKQNIAKTEHLIQAATDVGLDAEKFTADFNGPAKKLFEEDLALARKLGVRGFPTLFFSDGTEVRSTVYGSKPYEQFEQAVLNIHPEAEKTVIDNANPLSLFCKFPSLTAKEMAVILEISTQDAKNILDAASTNGIRTECIITKKTIKTGSVYFRK